MHPCINNINNSLLLAISLLSLSLYLLGERLSRSGNDYAVSGCLESPFNLLQLLGSFAGGSYIDRGGGGDGGGPVYISKHSLKKKKIRVRHERQ